MTKENIETKKKNIIAYLDNLISNYEEKIDFQISIANEEKHKFKKNMLLFTSILVSGLGLEFAFANTFLDTLMLIVTTPFVATSALGIPLAVITEVTSIIENNKKITEYQSLLVSAKKRKKYETKLLETNNPKKEKLPLNEILTSMINQKEAIESNYSKESIPELDNLLLEASQIKKKKVTIKDEKQKSLPIKEETQETQELSYNQKWLINRELETYAFAVKALLKAKQEGRLVEFLSENYNVTDEESISMYNALLEAEFYSDSSLLVTKDSIIEVAKSRHI